MCLGLNHTPQLGPGLAFQSRGVLGCEPGRNWLQVEGKTPLHFAAERGVQAAVKVLLDKGASAIVGDSQGRLPHHLASGKIHSLLVKETERQNGSSALKHRSVVVKDM